VTESPQIANIAKYVGTALLAFVIGMLPVLIGQLNGTGDIMWRPILAAGLSAILTAITATGLSARLTRVGSEGLGSQVDALREQGVHRRDMAVVEKAP
jgi:hypothetical protein